MWLRGAGVNGGRGLAGSSGEAIGRYGVGDIRTSAAAAQCGLWEACLELVRHQLTNGAQGFKDPTTVDSGGLEARDSNGIQVAIENRYGQRVG